ncbi:MAG: Hsp20/alpha crystallin family protein [Candidatus Paceibacteria bacterium]
MSFLQRLKENGAMSDDAVLLMDNETEIEAVAQLDVDVVQTESSVIVYAQAPGADIHDVHIAIEGEDNIVIIEGQRKRPSHLVGLADGSDGTFFAQECAWGKFYRRIILPDSVEIKKAEAKIKNGVLIVILPLLYTSEKSRSS